jgi:hypothetical protein
MKSIVQGSLACMALLLPLLATASCVTNRYGDTLCPPADTRCVQDRYGDWRCSAPGGGALLNRSGTPVCGVGRCVADLHGEVSCSTEARGSAALDRYRKAVCTAGCEAAREDRCTPLTK